MMHLVKEGFRRVMDRKLRALCELLQVRALICAQQVLDQELQRLNLMSLALLRVHELSEPDAAPREGDALDDLPEPRQRRDS